MRQSLTSSGPVGFPIEIEKLLVEVVADGPRCFVAAPRRHQMRWSPATSGSSTPIYSPSGNQRATNTTRAEMRCAMSADASPAAGEIVSTAPSAIAGSTRRAHRRVLMTRSYGPVPCSHAEERAPWTPCMGCGVLHGHPCRPRSGGYSVRREVASVGADTSSCAVRFSR